MALSNPHYSGWAHHVEPQLERWRWRNQNGEIRLVVWQSTENFGGPLKWYFATINYQIVKGSIICSDPYDTDGAAKMAALKYYEDHREMLETYCDQRYQMEHADDSSLLNSLSLTYDDIEK